MSRSDRRRPARNATAYGCLFAALLVPSLPGVARAVDSDSESDPDADDDSPAQDVGAVSVTATRASREILETAGNVSVHDREQIEDSGARTLPDLLRRESGISVINVTTNPTFVSVEARGSNNGGSAGSSVLVLVDGVRMNEADSGINDWALIDIDEVERVEVVRGPASALYGDNAFGAVVNIVTRPRPGPPRLAIHGSTGSYDSGHGSVSIAGTEGPVTMSLFARGITTEGYRDRSFYRAGSGNGSVEVDVTERVALGVAGGYYADQRRLPGALFDFEKDALGRRAASPRTETDRSDVDRHFVRGWIEAALAEGLILKINPHYHDRDEDTVITFIGQVPTSITTEKDAAGVDLQLQFDRSLFSLRNRLIAGGEFLREETTRDITSEDPFSPPLFTRSRQDTYAVFVQDELNLTPDLLLSAGVRFDYADYELRAFDGDDPLTGLPFNDATARPDYDVWSPKAALTYRLATPLAVYASYARGFRLPNFDEDTPLLPFLGFGVVEIPDLDVQLSDTYEIGAKYEAARIQAGLTLYHMRVKDELILDPFDFANINLERVIHNGIESSLRVDVLDWLSVYGSYTLEDVKIRRADRSAYVNQRLPINPLHRGTVGVQARLPCWVELAWNANIVGKRGLANDFTHQSLRLDTYASHDLYFDFRPPLGEHVEASLRFALYNFTGHKYSEFGAVSTFHPITFEPGIFDAFFPAATRSWLVGFALRVRR